MQFLRKAHWQILIALAVAVVAGAATPDSSGLIEFYGFLGDLFLRALKMIIVPLIFSSIVAGIASLSGMEGFGRLGLKTVAYYAFTSLLAIVTGLAMVNSIRPGLVDGKPNPQIIEAIERDSDALAATVESKVGESAGEGLGILLNTLRNMIPENILAAASDNGQMLPLIVVALLTAVGILFLSHRERESLLGFFMAVNALMLKITGWIMLFAPLGVFGLVAKTVASTDAGIILQLARYFATVAGALGIHLFVTLPLILFFVARVNPLRHFVAMREALLTAFSTASSAATLPMTIRGVQENAGVSRRVTSFVLPLGATVNMDGTALYECVAVIFVSQVLGQQMAVADQFAVVLLALLTSIGVAGIPSASLVAIIIILNNVGIEGAAAAMGLILLVDRPLDMIRTAVNIFSDSCGAVVIGRTEGEDGILARPDHGRRVAADLPEGR